MTAKKKSPLNFEKALDKLSNIVDQMETGDLSLERSLALFEEGVTLTRDCHAALKNAEQKVQMLVDNHADSELIDYEPSDDEIDDEDND